MESVAVVGTGISGLASAYMLRDECNLSVFEQNDYIGGHTNTITVDENGQSLPIDTGFMVYNEVTYPNLTKLFKELDVKAKPTDMSFSVRNRQLNLEWSGTGFVRLFGQRRNIVNLRFWLMLLELKRFNDTALEALEDETLAGRTVRDFLKINRLSDDMINLYLLPMMSSLWSAPPVVMLEFPISPLIRFMYTHGLLSMYGKHPWLTVQGGAKTYVEAITASYRNKIELDTKVVKVSRSAERKVALRLANGAEKHFDKCILACHADQAFAILDESCAKEKQLLAPFKYQANSVLVHTDESVMPASKTNWAAWNYLLDTEHDHKSTTHYWMNKLQQVSENVNYFVSLNAESIVDQKKIIKRISYHHPIFTCEAMKAQTKLREGNHTKEQNIFLCGSYFSYGFHEDALSSALDVTRIIQGVGHEQPNLLPV